MIRSRSFPMARLRSADLFLRLGRGPGKRAAFLWVASFFLIGGLTTTTAQADGGPENQAQAKPGAQLEEAEESTESIGANDQDPAVMLQDIRRRRTERDSLLATSPIHGVVDLEIVD